MIECSIPLIGFSAYSGTGKTTMLLKLIPLLKNKGLKVGVIKHAHHHFEVDQPGKDSYELRKAGAAQMLIGSKKRWALMSDNDQGDYLTLQDHINHIHQDDLDLLLIEGFKPESIPKIELIRPSLGKEPFYLNDKSVVAVATDADLPVATQLPILDLNHVETICDFIIQRFRFKV